MKKPDKQEEARLDAMAQIKKVSDLQNIARVIAEGQIKHGNMRWNGQPCYKCMMSGKPTIIVAE